jgi:hypothetical protein
VLDYRITFHPFFVPCMAGTFVYQSVFDLVMG